MILTHGLLVLLEVGVVLRLVLVHEETEEDVGDGGPRVYHGPSCRLAIDTVCWRLYCGLAYSLAWVRQGEFEVCCMATDFAASIKETSF
jgi:hypothetical protein